MPSHGDLLIDLTTPKPIPPKVYYQPTTATLLNSPVQVYSPIAISNKQESLHPDFTPTISKAIAMSFARSQSFIVSTPSQHHSALAAAAEKRGQTTSRKNRFSSSEYPPDLVLVSKENHSPINGRKLSFTPVPSPVKSKAPSPGTNSTMASPTAPGSVKRVVLSRKPDLAALAPAVTLEGHSATSESSFPFTPSINGSISKPETITNNAFSVPTPQVSRSTSITQDAEIPSPQNHDIEPKSPVRKEMKDAACGPGSKKRSPTTPLTPYRYRSRIDEATSPLAKTSPMSGSRCMFTKRRSLSPQTHPHSSPGFNQLFLDAPISKIETPARRFRNDFAKAKADVENKPDLQYIAYEPAATSDEDVDMDARVFDETVSIKHIEVDKDSAVESQPEMVLPSCSMSVTADFSEFKNEENLNANVLPELLPLEEKKDQEEQQHKVRSVKRTHFFDEVDNTSSSSQKKDGILPAPILANRAAFTSSPSKGNSNARKSFGTTSEEDFEDDDNRRPDENSAVATPANVRISLNDSVSHPALSSGGMSSGCNNSSKKMWRRDSFTAYSEGGISFPNVVVDDEDNFDSDPLSAGMRAVQAAAAAAEAAAEANEDNNGRSSRHQRVDAEESDDETNMSMVFFKVKQQQQKQELEKQKQELVKRPESEGHETVAVEIAEPELAPGHVEIEEEEKEERSKAAAGSRVSFSVSPTLSRAQSPALVATAPLAVPRVHMVDHEQQTDELMEDEVSIEQMKAEAVAQERLVAQTEMQERLAAQRAEFDAALAAAQAATEEARRSQAAELAAQQEKLAAQQDSLRAEKEAELARELDEARRTHAAEVASVRLRQTLEAGVVDAQRRYNEWVYETELNKVQSLLSFMELERRFGICH